MRKAILIVLLLLGTFVVVQASPVQAKKTIRDAGSFLKTTTDETGLKETDPVQVSAIVLNGAFALVGLIFLILMVYGGISWMLARENDEIATKARNTVKHAAIGLIIIAGAYTITYFFTDLFQRGAQVG